MGELLLVVLDLILFACVNVYRSSHGTASCSFNSLLQCFFFFFFFRHTERQSLSLWFSFSHSSS